MTKPRALLVAVTVALAVAALPALAATIQVSVVDNAFQPAVATAAQGDTVRWTWNGFSAHTVTDNTGMALYDSHALPRGSTFTHVFDAAGKYAYVCTIHFGMTGKVQVPIVVTPESGSVNTTFTVKTAAVDAPAGFVYDTQIKRPGQRKFANWRTAQTDATLDFLPDRGNGTYAFRSRLRKTSNGKTSKYSPKDSIVVS